VGKVAKKKRFTFEVPVPDGVGSVDNETFRTVVRAAYNKEVDRITTEKFNPWVEDLVNARSGS